jgi:O-antigen ligase
MIAFSLAASRGGFVGLAVGFLLLTAQSAARWRKLAFLGLFVVPALILAPNPVIQRFLNPGSGDNAAVQAREITWSAGLRMVAAHPLAGVGLYRFRQLVLLYEDPSQIQVRTLAHNTYIEVAAEQGLPGLLLFVTALGMIAAGLRRAIHASRGAGHLLLSKGARGLQAALVSTVVCAFFVSAGWNRFFWFVFFLGAAAARVGQAEPAAAVEGPDEASLDAGESSEPVTASGLLASTC